MSFSKGQGRFFPRFVNESILAWVGGSDKGATVGVAEGALGAKPSLTGKVDFGTMVVSTRASRLRLALSTNPVNRLMDA